MFRTLTTFPNGVKPEYTFFTDFDIASHFGIKAIRDTYRDVINLIVKKSRDFSHADELAIF